MPSDEPILEKPGRSAYVGLIPAAGIGSRLPERKLSKEVLPVSVGGHQEKPVISCLLSSFVSAGIEEVTIVLRHEKQDVAGYLAEEEWRQIRFSQIMTGGTSGVPETVALGLRDLARKRIAFGFPDILFAPKDAYKAMMHKLDNTEAEVVLGLFPTNTPGKMDMVETDGDGIVTDIEIKPGSTVLSLTWILAVWKPSFTRYLLDRVRQSSHSKQTNGEAHLGHAFRLAATDGFQINSVSFPAGRSLDIGTPGDLALAQSWNS